MSENKLKFPFPKDSEVDIYDDYYSINIVAGSVIISSQGSTPEDVPVNPACIVIDEKRIYLRRNWESWHTINTANKVFVKKLMESATCLIYDSVGGMTEEYRIPIYKLSNFPEKLFKPGRLEELLSPMSKDETKKGENNDENKNNNDESEIEDFVDDADIVEMLPDKMLNCTKALGVDIIPRLEVNGHHVDLAFRTENVSVLCGLLFGDESSNEEKQTEDDLYYVKDDMLRETTDSECHVVLLIREVGSFRPQYETTNVMTEDGLIDFLEKIFGNKKD